MKNLPFSKQVAMEATFRGDGPEIFKGYEHNLTGAYLRGLALEDADMRNVILAHSNLEFAKLTRTKLDCADLRHAKMYHADLPESSLVGANLSFANLELAFFKDADLRRVNLKYARLTTSDLRGANLSGANLEMAIFYKAKLHGVVWDGAGQLSKVATLYGVEGLEPDIKEKLLEEHLCLFDEWADDLLLRS